MIAALALLAAAAAVTPTPSPAAIADARTIAANGTLSTLLPLISAKETDALVAAHPELTAAEQTDLRATARQVADKGIARLREAEAQAMLRALSPADLATLAQAARSEAAGHMRAAMPSIIAATVASAGDMRFKEDVAAAFCTRTGKLCTR